MKIQFQNAVEAVLKAHNLLEWFYSGKKFYARLDHPYFDRTPRKVLQ